MPDETRGKGFVPFAEKIVGLQVLLDRLQIHRSRKEKIVFTNGCFDILHPGHIAYLEEARARGDLLVVGLNTDSSVRKLKGSERPINSQEDRAIMMAGLTCVDYVTFFDEDTPIDLIREVKPDVLVKGGDWTIDKIVGADYVQSRGGQVYSLPFRQGYSTTSLIERIKALRDTKG